MAFILQSTTAALSSADKAITQSAHGFAVGDWVYLLGSTYTKTDSDLSASSDSVGVVTAVTPNTFTLTTSGYVTGLTGLVAGSRYYLSGTAGTITATPPASNIKAVFIADSTTGGYVQQYSVGASSQSLTYGRVSASINLVSKAFPSTGVGATIDFTSTVYSRGITFSGTSGIIPSLTGRYRAAYYLNAGSDVTAYNATVKVVQDGISLGSVYINQHNSAGSVNQSTGFIDVDVIAGTPVFLHYQPDTTESIEFDQGSYFDLSQLPTAVAAVVNTVAENGIVYPSANTTIGGGNTSSASSALFFTFTLPSAGEWEVNYATRVSTTLSAGNAGFYVGVFDNGTIVPNTELQIFQDTTIGGTSFPGGTVTGITKIITTAAKAYQIRVWENNGIGGQAISDGNGRSYVFYKKIAGGVPLTFPKATGGIVFGDGNSPVQDLNNLFYDDVNNRLGVGTNTPSERLDVVGTAQGGSSALKISNFGGGLGWGLRMSPINNGGDYFRFDRADGNQVGTIYNSGAAGSDLGLSAQDDLVLGSAYTERLRIKANGNIGIGTNNPTAKTQIVSAATANATGEPLLKLSSNYAGGSVPGAGGSLLFTDEANTSVGEIRSLTNSSNTVELAFSTFNGGVLSEKVRISPDGKLGVGVTTPLNKLHIGTASVANTGGIRLPITSASANQTGSPLGVNSSGDVVKIAAGSAFQIPVVQIFTTSATYTPTPGLRYAIIEAVGPGGAAPAIVGTGATTFSGAGGAGAYIKLMLTAAQIGASRELTININHSSMQDVFTANAGGPGVSKNAVNNAIVSASGGAGGQGFTFLGIDLGSRDGDHGDSTVSHFTSPDTLIGGHGGSSQLGRGGRGAQSSSGGSTGGDGGFGGGAGANVVVDSTQSLPQVNGGSGRVIITEYFN